MALLQRLFGLVKIGAIACEIVCKVAREAAGAEQRGCLIVIWCVSRSSFLYRAVSRGWGAAVLTRLYEDFASYSKVWQLRKSPSARMIIRNRRAHPTMI
jgi:hypothetical protein